MTPLSATSNNKQHTLLVLTGFSPQVVTETIYAFYQQHQIQFNALKLITFSQGKIEASHHLLGNGKPEQGKLHALYQDYGLTPIPFNKQDILLIRNQDGSLLENASSSAELVQVGDFMLNTVRQLTSDPNTTLHVSLAGGRKTYAYYLGYAMSIFARQHDTLNHVFVQNEYESSAFFYPTPYPSPIYLKGRSLDAHDAKVELVTIPMIRQREGLPQRVLTGNASFEQCVEIGNSINRPVSLELNLAQRSITCSEVKLLLPPSVFAFYLMLVLEMLDENEGYQCPANDKPNRLLAIHYLQARLLMQGFEQVPDTLDQLVAFTARHQDELEMQTQELEGLSHGMKASFFSDKKNKIAKLLKEQLPHTVAEHYDIDALRAERRDSARKPAAYFGIKLPQECVRFCGPIQPQQITAELAIAD